MKGLNFAIISVISLLPAGATVLYDNLSNGADLGIQIRDNGPSPTANGYQSFTSGVASSISSVTLALNWDGSLTGGVTVDLYSSSGGAPSTLLSTIGTISDSDLSVALGTFQNFVFTPSGVNLDAGTQYFIVVFGSTSPRLGADALWEIALDNSGIGTSGQIGSGLDGPPMVMQVVDASTVPEPGALWLCVPALVVLGWRHKKLLRQQIS